MSDPPQQPDSYGPQAFSGGRWGAVRTVAIQAISFAITAVLTRILDSDAFGLVAIAFVVVTMFDLLTRVGFGASVIRRKELDHRIASSFFWAAVGLGLVAAAVAVLLAEPTARLAGSADAAALVAAAAATLPINLGERVVGGLLTRDLRWRAVATIDVVGTFVHGVAAIGLAFAGAGAWAIIIGQIARSVFRLGGSMVAARFIPSPVILIAPLREDLRFNLNLLAGDITSYANRNLDYWFVGNRLGSSALGFYYVAYILPNLLRQRFNAIGHDVLYPVASKIQDDLQRVGAAYLRVVRLLSFLVLPTMLGLAVVADLAVRIGFGPNWDEAVAPLRLIAIGSAVMGVGVVARPIFDAIGRPGIRVRVGIVGLVALAIGLAFSWSDGTLVGVAAAVVVASSVESGLVLRAVKQVLGVGWAAQGRAVLPFLAAAVVMAGLVVGVRALLGPVPIVLEAAVAVVTGVVGYFGTGFALFGGQFRGELSVLRRFVGR